MRAFISKYSDIKQKGPAEDQPVRMGNRMHLDVYKIRLDEDDQEKIVECFNKIKDQENLINKFAFRIEVLGAQVPDVIAERIFCIFASVVSSQSVKIKEIQNMEVVSTVGNSNAGETYSDKMDFIDLVQCYFVFKQQRPNEVSQLCFEMIKLTKDAQMISRDDLAHWCVRILQLNENFVNLFYHRTKFDPRVPINKDEFCQAFINTQEVQEIQFFQCIPQIINEFKNEYLNCNSEVYGKHLSLTQVHVERIGEQSKEAFGIDISDIENIREFFLEEIIGQSNEHILNIYSKLFENIVNLEVKNFLMFKITKFKANDFDFFQKLVGYTISETTKKQKLEFFFELVNDFQELMNQENCITFCKMFRGKPPNSFSLSVKEFYLHFSIQNLEKIEDYLAAKSMMIGIMGIKSTGSLQEQQEAIAAVMGQLGEDELDLERYIHEHLQSEKTFYIVNKHFWDSWSASTIQQRKCPPVINNKSFILEGHQKRWMEEISWNHDFVVVPKYVFIPLTKWYNCNKVIELNTTFQQDTIKIEEQYQNESDLMELHKHQIGEANTKDIEQHGGPAQNKSTYQSPEKDSLKMTNISNMNVQYIENETEEGKYNLQLYPMFLYFDKIDKNGIMPHQQAIFNNKIDTGYLKKYVKNNKIPFQELSISKHTKMDSILNMITESYNETSTKRARMIINDQVITGLKLQQTVEDIKLETGTLIYIEFLNFNNTWPTENEKKISTTSGKGSKFEQQETVGLYNMGNTCYMNSALQCLANIKHFHTYFVKNKTFSVQINKNNALGYKGALVEAFSNLMHQMWNSNQVVVPKGFKHTQSKINEIFGGDDQQDTQEYINFLIDGLHEETNMRNDKPYIEAPECDGKEMIELGLETWSNQIQRDWSFIYFLFYGQWQSTLECLSCKKRSTKFEVNNSVALSLPEPSKVLLNIIVHRLPQAIKQIIQPNQKKQSIDKTMVGQESTEIFEDNYSVLTNDQPIHICLKVPKNIRVQELIRRIVEVKEVNINAEHFINQNFTDLFLYSKQLGTVRGIFDPLNKLTQYKLITNEIHAQEALSPRGKDYVVQMWQHNAEWIAKSTTTLSYLVRDYQIWGKFYLEEQQRPKKSEQFTMQYIFNNHYAACEKFETLLQYQRMPLNILVVAYHRRFVQRENKLFSEKQPSMLSHPIVLQMPLFPTGRRIYEEVWAMAQVLLQKESKYLSSLNQQNDILWWTDEDYRDVLNETKPTGTLKPFVLKYVDRQGYNCSKCNWVQRCSGCIIEPNEDMRIPDFTKLCHIAIEWDSSMIEEQYNPTVNEYLKHKSSDKVQVDDEDQIITLESCLKKFHAVEKLQDEVNCEQCKIPRIHFKFLQAFQLPPILPIQLKRFKKTGNAYRKQGNTVEFPLYNLDMTPYLQDEKFLHSIGISTKYDLFGIINHYGSLTFGHYISVVKNPYSKKWYKYDDQRRIEIQESQITKENAYILFYVRKDVDNKEISDLFPDSNVIFPGKPVSTRFGKGFVLGRKEDKDDEVYYVRIKKELFEVKKEDILKHKSDKFIEMCEAERANLEQKMITTSSPGPSSYFQGFISLFYDPNNGQIKDHETEKNKLSFNNQEDAPPPPPAVKRMTSQTNIQILNKIQEKLPEQSPTKVNQIIKQKSTQKIIKLSTKEDLENDKAKPDNGPQSALTSFGVEITESMNEAQGQNSSAQSKRKKKKKVKKILENQDNLITELTALSNQLL